MDKVGQPKYKSATAYNLRHEWWWAIILWGGGLVFYEASNHLRPSSFILPVVVAVVGVITWLKFQDWLTIPALVAPFILLLFNFVPGGHALSNGTWYSGLLPAQATVATCPSGAVSADDANSVVGSQATVEGNVVSTHFASTSTGSPTFLDFHDPYQGHFIVVIWGDQRSNFNQPPEDTYNGQHVCVSGQVSAYAGASEIVVDSPQQIQVVR